MTKKPENGQVNLTAIAVLVGAIIAAVWIWKRLPTETQELVIDEGVPIAAATAVLLAVVLALVKKLKRRCEARRQRDRLLAQFQRETASDKRLELSFALAEISGYRVEGLEAVVPELKELWIGTLRRALGDKQHRIRGMAASHLGILQDRSVVPLLIKALEDDHAYVRSCAALGLGRLRATEARERLVTVMQEDWDQTVRSRAREAVERMRPA